MTNVVLGKVAFTWKGAFSTSTTYYLQDVVSYTDGSGFTNSYVCKVATAAAGAFDGTTNFELFASGTGVALNSGDLVYNNGTTIVALPIGTANQVLEVDSTTLLPSWTSIPTATSKRVKYLPRNNGQSTQHRENYAIMEDLSIQTWGSNTRARLRGSNSSATYGVPADMPFPKGFTGVYYNTTHQLPMVSWTWGYRTHIIDTNKDLWTMGYYQTSSYDSGGIGAQRNAMIPFNVTTWNNAGNDIYGKNIEYIAQHVGSHEDDSVFVISDEGLIYAAGYNGYGQLGTGTSTAGEDTAGGYNEFKQLPFFADLKSTSNVTVTTLKTGREEYKSVHAITSDNKLYNWGYNYYGQLGRGTSSNNSTHRFSIPTHINLGSLLASNGETNGIVVDVYPTGYYGVFVKTSDGNLSFMGFSDDGCSGLGPTSDTEYNIPTRTIATGDVNTVIALPYDYQNTWVLKTDGTVLHAGNNASGCGGHGNTSAVGSWVAMPLTVADGNDGEGPMSASETVTKIVCGGTNNYPLFCCLTDAGKVYHCGYGGNGQSGRGHANSTNNRLALMPCQRTVTDIGITGYDTYTQVWILTDDGQMFGCGYGGWMAFGGEDGDNSWVFTPIRF